jgi:hypothetical protein
MKRDDMRVSWPQFGSPCFIVWGICRYGIVINILVSVIAVIFNDMQVINAGLLLAKELVIYIAWRQHERCNII